MREENQVIYSILGKTLLMFPRRIVLWLIIWVGKIETAMRQG